MPTKALVGYTGFVGSNIYAAGDFEAVYNSKNISEAYGTSPDLLVYSGLRAEKFLANNAPEKDMELIIEAENNISRIAPKKLVLISTVDVFKNPVDVDENSEIDTEGLHAYGLDRYRLEQWVRENYKDALIIRLPGLFGKNLKKNFIFDMINIIPSMLKAEKYRELSEADSLIAESYVSCDNGFYKLQVNDKDRSELKKHFLDAGFSALNFTDSRSSFQFYPLTRLWKDIQTAIKNDIRLWHPATEPVSAEELYYAVMGGKFSNIVSQSPAKYDYKTVYSELFGGKDGYIESKESIIRQIKDFYDNAVQCD